MRDVSHETQVSPRHTEIWFGLVWAGLVSFNQADEHQTPGSQTRGGDPSFCCAVL